MVVVAGDLAKWREVGVEGSDQGNFGVRDSGHGLFLQSGVSGDMAFALAMACLTLRVLCPLATKLFFSTCE